MRLSDACLLLLAITHCIECAKYGTKGISHLYPRRSFAVISLPMFPINNRLALLNMSNMQFVWRTTHGTNGIAKIQILPFNRNMLAGNLKLPIKMGFLPAASTRGHMTRQVKQISMHPMSGLSFNHLLRGSINSLTGTPWMMSAMMKSSHPTSGAASIGTEAVSTKGSQQGGGD